MKKIFLLFAGLLTVAASYAQEPIGSSTTTWKVSGSVLTISGTGDMPDLSESGRPWQSSAADIEEVIVEDGVTSLGKWAFGKLANLKRVTLANSIKVIWNDALKECPYTEITMPSSLTAIYGFAFYGSKLTEVDLSNTNLTNLGDNAFFGSHSMITAKLPYTMSLMGAAAFGACSHLTSIEVHPSNPYYVSVDGVVYDKAMTALYAYPGGKDTTHYTVPQGIIEIKREAFREAKLLTSISLPNGLAIVGEGAFHACENITSLTIPYSVTTYYNADGKGNGKAFKEFRNCAQVTALNPEPVRAAKNAGSDSKNGDDIFDQIASKIGNKVTLRVPNGSKAAYEATIGWNNYFTAITELPLINVASVELNKSVDTLLRGDSVRLVTFIAPDSATNQRCIWTSSDTAVATVGANGMVKAVAAGEATITVRTVDGNFSDTYTLTVEAPIEVTGVTLNKTTMTLAKKGDKEKLTATVVPEGALNKNVTWLSNDPSIAAVSDAGVVTAVGDGVATITVTTEENEHTATCTVTVGSISPNAVSKAELLPLTLYPNPVTNGQLVIDSEQWQDGESVEVYNLSGALVAKYTGKQTSINISQLPAGTYVVKVGKYAAKMVKQ